LSWSKSYGGTFLVSSDNSCSGYIRYSPKIKAGKYRVSLHSPLYSQEIITKQMNGFYVNISSRDGIVTKWINPIKSLEIGEFNFASCDGYVEILSRDAKGLVVADALIFEKIEN
jgi:hypothetical protein